MFILALSLFVVMNPAHAQNKSKKVAAEPQLVMEMVKTFTFTLHAEGNPDYANQILSNGLQPGKTYEVTLYSVKQPLPSWQIANLLKGENSVFPGEFGANLIWSFDELPFQKMVYSFGTDYVAGITITPPLLQIGETEWQTQKTGTTPYYYLPDTKNTVLLTESFDLAADTYFVAYHSK